MDVRYSAKDGLTIKTKRGSVTIALSGEATMVGRDVKTPFVVHEPGEYEVEGISLFGYAHADRVVWVVQVEELRVLYLPALTVPLSERLREELDSIDVVAPELDGSDQKILIDTIASVEPSYVLPLGETSRESFVKMYEHGSREATSLPLAKATLPQEATEVVILT
jgi:hypothetical protein